MTACQPFAPRCEEPDTGPLSRLLYRLLHRTYEIHETAELWNDTVPPRLRLCPSPYSEPKCLTFEQWEDERSLPF